MKTLSSLVKPFYPNQQSLNSLADRVATLFRGPAGRPQALDLPVFLGDGVSQRGLASP